MSGESIVFFVLALMVWGLSVAARWFQEQINKQSTDGLEFEPIDWSSDQPFEGESIANISMPSDKPQQPSRTLPNVGKVDKDKKTLQRFGLGQSQTLRQGIILMTVLGPCRALESPNNSKLF